MKWPSAVLFRLQVLAVLPCCFSIVAALTPPEAKTMTANVQIQGGVDFQPSYGYNNNNNRNRNNNNNNNNDFEIASATARLNYYPRGSYSQEVFRLNVEGVPEPTGGIFEKQANMDKVLELEWDYPTTASCQFQVTSTVQTTNEIVPVINKVRFPVDPMSLQFDPGMEAYIRTNYEIADSNNRIRNLARRIVAGTDDLYEASFRIADWVHSNIEYTLGSDQRFRLQFNKNKVIKTASSVLQDGYGKCDEMTALFLSLARSEGIPSRFVRGYSYTEEPEQQDPDAGTWGGHAWAEVWFPGTGWVPFDVAKGEFGYLNCGSIMLGVSEDATDTTVEYSAQGRDIELITRDMTTRISPQSVTPCMERGDAGIEFYLNSQSLTASAGSVVTLVATLKNCNDYYACTRLELADTADTRLVNGQALSNILLMPLQTKTIPFEVQISPDLTPGYSYEFPFTIHSGFGRESELSIEVTGDQDYSYNNNNNNNNRNRRGGYQQNSGYGDYQGQVMTEKPFFAKKDGEYYNRNSDQGMDNVYTRQTFNSNDDNRSNSSYPRRQQQQETRRRVQGQQQQGSSITSSNNGNRNNLMWDPTSTEGRKYRSQDGGSNEGNRFVEGQRNADRVNQGYNRRPSSPSMYEQAKQRQTFQDSSQNTRGNNNNNNNNNRFNTNNNNYNQRSYQNGQGGKQPWYMRTSRRPGSRTSTSINEDNRFMNNDFERRNDDYRNYQSDNNNSRRFNNSRRNGRQSFQEPLAGAKVMKREIDRFRQNLPSGGIFRDQYDRFDRYNNNNRYYNNNNNSNSNRNEPRSYSNGSSYRRNDRGNRNGQRTWFNRVPGNSYRDETNYAGEYNKSLMWDPMVRQGVPSQDVNRGINDYGFENMNQYQRNNNQNQYQQRNNNNNNYQNQYQNQYQRNNNNQNQYQRNTSNNNQKRQRFNQPRQPVGQTTGYATSNPSTIDQAGGVLKPDDWYQS